MNTNNPNNYDQKYSDLSCDYCPTRPILPQFQDYTGSEEDCQRLREYIAREICNVDPSRYNPPSMSRAKAMSPSNNVQSRFIDVNNPQNQRFDPNNAYNQNNGYIQNDGYHQANGFDPNRPKIGCCNNAQYLCVKKPREELITGLPCQTNGNMSPCCFTNGVQDNQRYINRPTPPPVATPLPTRECLPAATACGRVGCIHKTPQNVCLYDEPCKAHCFNTPPGMKPFRYNNGY